MHRLCLISFYKDIEQTSDQNNADSVWLSLKQTVNYVEKFSMHRLEPSGKEVRLLRENVCAIMVLLEKWHENVTLMEESVPSPAIPTS